MEDELDEIARGTENRTQWLTGFYFGDADADESTAEAIARRGGLKSIIENNLEAIDARRVNSLELFRDDEDRPVYVRVGRYGPYLERQVGVTDEGEPEYQRANLPESTTPDEVTKEMAEKLFATPPTGRELGANPKTGRTVVAKEGRYGPYVTELVRDDERATAEARAEEIIATERAEEDAQRKARGRASARRTGSQDRGRAEEKAHGAARGRAAQACHRVAVFLHGARDRHLRGGDAAAFAAA